MNAIERIAQSTRLASMSIADLPAARMLQRIEPTATLASLTWQESPATKDFRRMFESIRLASTSIADLPAARMLQRIEPTATLASLIWQESPATKDFRRIAQSIRLASTSIADLPATRMLQRIEPTATLASLAWQESPATKDFRRMAQSTRLASTSIADLPAARMLQRIEPTATLASLAWQESPATKDFRRMFESTRLASLAVQGLPTPRTLQEMVGTAKLTCLALQESPAMKALRSLSNLPFSSIVREDIFRRLDALEISPSELENPPESAFALDHDSYSEIERELSTSNDYNVLSDNGRKLLSYVYHYYILPLFLACVIGPMIESHNESVRVELSDYKTTKEIKSYLRNPPKDINTNLLKSFRVTIGSDVHLREAPTTKSKIVAKLPLGKLIEVLDKENRSWLLVEVDIEGEPFVGWVSRRYTTYFK